MTGRPPFRAEIDVFTWPQPNRIGCPAASVEAWLSAPFNLDELEPGLLGRACEEC